MRLRPTVSLPQPHSCPVPTSQPSAGARQELRTPWVLLCKEVTAKPHLTLNHIQPCARVSAAVQKRVSSHSPCALGTTRLRDIPEAVPARFASHHALTQPSHMQRLFRLHALPWSGRCLGWAGLILSLLSVARQETPSHDFTDKLSFPGCWWLWAACLLAPTCSGSEGAEPGPRPMALLLLPEL